jgi:BirA family transcriptional regulator, biotin operon repressor / biotin---[acetyl-CoA-carboxylase] ligase
MDASEPILRRLFLEEVDSTQDEVRRLLRERPEPCLVVARSQRCGRGRGQGRKRRTWMSPPGGLYLSLGWPVGPFEACPHVWPAAAAVACCELVRGYHQGIGIKWPNDLVAGDRKLAGVLAEVVAPAPASQPVAALSTSPKSVSTAAPAFIIIGIGINVQTTVDGDFALPSVCLADLVGQPIDLDYLTAQLCEQLPLALSACRDAADVRARYRALCVSVGTRVTVRDAGQEVSGLAEDIADDFSLLLRTAAGLQRIYAGDCLPT